MSFYTLWAVAFGLSMDAFAVSVCKGLSMPSFRWSNALKAGFYFGLFQAIMPLLGFLLGVRFSESVKSFDHWLAFGLLSLIGINMLRAAFSDGEEQCDGSFSVKTMLTLAVATSIDALVIGVSFAFLTVNIVPAVFIIGSITAVLSVIGVKSGYFLGSRIRSKAEILGGVVLIVMAVKILLEHTLLA
ncbi:manganese efflux pump MntP family protein [Pasteurellaceae bacterium LIM206]|nr:manganese efflux pump MntP family protein [Pasteurellaceae bacterium LIM206]